MQSGITFLKYAFLLGLFLISFFAISSTTYAATVCNGKAIPDGFTCPPPRTPQSPSEIIIGKLPNGETAAWIQCDDLIANTDICTNGWRPAYQRNGGYVGVSEASVFDPAAATVEGVVKECAARGGTITERGGCILGGVTVNAFAGLGEVIVKAVGSILSLKNIFYLTSVIAWLILMGAQIFMGFAAWWLDGSVYYSMVLMGYFINHEVSAKGIQFVWAFVRDLTNVLIIGGFVAVGISTILQVSQYAADKFLARLIIAALLVNFSYFITGAIIDSANFIGIQIYNSDLIQNECPENSAKGTVTGPIRLANSVVNGEVCGFARSLVGTTGMTSWDKIKESSRGASGIKIDSKTGATNDAGFTVNFDAENPKCFANPGSPGCAPQSNQSTNYYFMLTMLSLMGAAFAILLGWVFMKAALYFLARFAILIILLVTSPLGVGGTGVPFIGQFTGRWWSALISQAVFAPLFLFLIGTSLMTVKQFSLIFAGGGKIPIADAFFAVQHSAGQGIFTSLLPIFITYFLAVVFMYVSYIISSQVANSVAEFKGIYDFAGKQADTFFKSPLTTAQRLVGAPAQWATEQLAAQRLPGARRASIWLQYGNEFMTGKKREGSVGEEVNKRIDEMIDNRYDTAASAGGGLFSRSPVWKKDKDRTPEERDSLKKDSETLTAGQLLRKYGRDGVNQLAKERFITPEKLEEIRKSSAYSKDDKKKITESYFSEFTGALKKATDNPKDASAWQAAAEKFDNLTDLERQLLLTERKELRDNKEFYSRVKSDSFNSLIKDQSDGVKKDMRDRRLEAMKGQLKDTSTEAQGRDILKRMSNDEKAKLDLKTVTHLAGTGALSAADAHHIHKYGTEDVREFLRNHPKYKHMLSGTGVPNDEEKPKEKTDDAPKEDKK